MALFNKTWGALSAEDKDLAGRRVGSMIVKELANDPKDDEYDKWVVKCDCGAESVKDGRNLRKEKPQQSCGHTCPYHPRYSR